MRKDGFARSLQTEMHDRCMAYRCIMSTTECKLRKLMRSNDFLALEMLKITRLKPLDSWTSNKLECSGL